MLSFEKQEAALGLILSKLNVNITNVQVGAVFDVSGSMDDEIRDGQVQECVNRLFVLGLKFDDNGEIDVWKFNTNCQAIRPCTIDTVEHFVKKNIKAGGGTNYSSFVNAVMDHYFPNKGIREVQVGTKREPIVEKQRVQVTTTSWFGLRKKIHDEIQDAVVGYKDVPIVDKTTVWLPNENDVPKLVTVITDGDTESASKFVELLAKTQDLPIYRQMVGISNGSNFNLLKEVAQKFPKVGFMHFRDLRKTDDETMYSNLVNEEFVNWLKAEFPQHVQ